MIIHVEEAHRQHEETRMYASGETQFNPPPINNTNMLGRSNNTNLQRMVGDRQRYIATNRSIDINNMNTMSRFLSTSTRVFRRTGESMKDSENVPISTIEDMYNYPKEDPIVIDARENLIRETIKKEEEIKHKIQIERELQIQNRLLEMKPKGPVNGLKYTFDCNGTVLSIKNPLTEKLPNECLFSKYISH
jgi:hypothetical protein